MVQKSTILLIFIAEELYIINQYCVDINTISYQTFGQSLMDLLSNHQILGLTNYIMLITHQNNIKFHASELMKRNTRVKKE